MGRSFVTGSLCRRANEGKWQDRTQQFVPTSDSVPIYGYRSELQQVDWQQ